MANNLLEITNLYISLKKPDKTINAVDGISFSIKEGEILGIAGESGCGKTLTALSIVKLLPQKAKILGGKIEYNNMSLRSMDESELVKIRGKEISAIFQEYRYSLNPLIKVGRQIKETLELGCNSNETGSRQNNKRRTVEILYRLGFSEPKKIYNAYPHELSGGMCQRIMTAIAVIGRPRLLLADEPSSALDAISQEHVFSMLEELNRDYGTAILIISHDLSLLKKFCSRYLIMYAGKIIEEGPSHTLFSPLHPYTKALAGAIPDRDKRGSSLETIPGKVPSIEDNLKGCPFAPRCKKAETRCFETFPPASKAGKGRIVYCYLYGEAVNG